MASTTTTTSSRFLLLSAVLLLAAAAAASGALPSYCASGQAIPRAPLPGCRWYVASRICGDMMMLMYPPAVFGELCCQQLRAVPGAAGDDGGTALTIGGDRGSPVCSQALQARFAAAVVAKGECGLPTIHGGPFCRALHDE